MPPFDIDPETIRKLAELMTETGLSEIEMAEGDRRVRVSRAAMAAPVHFAASTAAPAVAPAAVSPASNPGAVTSPMVGTAYLQAEPGAPPFVSVGSTVRVGDTLLIIEAMKVMNPIKAPKSGVVSQILISDGQPVEYGEPMMIVE
jgi:acetyl-CoA carboxylase biotin carboxyl carrier protein